MGSLRRRFDLSIDGKGYMLMRNHGRAWERSGLSDARSKYLSGYEGMNDEAKFSSLPDEVDFSEVWDDWSGGFGHAYRTPERRNTYHYSENMDPRFPGQLVLAQEPQKLSTPSININVERFFDIPLTGVANAPVGAGAVGILGRGFLAALAPTNITGSPFIVNSSVAIPGSHNGRPALFGSYLYCAIGPASPFIRYDFSLTATTGPFPSDSFIIAGGRLWSQQGNHYLRSVAAGAEPMSLSNWSATLNIGNGLYAIQDMVELGDQLFAGMPDGIYAGDTSGSFYNVLPGPAAAPNQDNGRDLDIINGSIVAPYADDIVYLRPSALVAEAGHIGPQGYNPNRSQIFGRLRCIRGYGPWYYVGAWTGANSYLLAGRPDKNGMIWHTLQKLDTTSRISRIHFDGITTTSGNTDVPPRCWIATDASGFTGTAPLYYFNIPRLNGNPLTTDPVFSPNYCTQGRMDLGIIDRGMPGVPKIFRSVEVWSDGLNASLAGIINLYYFLDGSASRVYLGQATESPKHTIYFPSGEGSFITGQSIALTFDVITLGDTPVIRAVVLRGTMRPRTVNIINVVVRIADNIVDRSGATMRSAAAMITELRNLAGSDTTPQPVRLIDLVGAEQWVTVLPPVAEREVYQQGDDYPEIAATIKMAVLEFTSYPWGGIQ